MSAINTDITQVRFVHSGMKTDTFSVKSIIGTDRIGALYSFEVLLHSDNHDIALSDMVMGKATLFFNRLGSFYPYSGIVTSFEYVDTNVDFSVYKAILQPQLWKLTLSRQNRIFLKKRIPDIIAQILDETGLKEYYQVNLGKTYPEREYVAQYDETDFNFICRHMETAGIWYQFAEMPLDDGTDTPVGEERLIISDNAASFKNLPTESSLLYRSATAMVELIDKQVKESIDDLALYRRLAPKTVVVKSHNYHKPEIDLSHVQQVDNGDFGVVYEYGGTFETSSEAQRAGEILSDRLSYAQISFQGCSDCRGLRAGAIITVNEHPRDDCNGELLITEVRHTVISEEDREDRTSPPYRNHFIAVPAEKAAHFQIEMNSSPGAVPGLISALIEANGSEYAYLDEYGHYKLRMPFDRSNTANTMGTNFIRQVQAYSGAGYGVHLPSHENTEMLIGHLLGNPDRPVGMATVPNAETISPVTSENHQQAIIRTAGENEIVMDDTDRKKKISMTTSYDQSFSAQGNKTVAVGGDRTITVKKNETGSVETDQKITIGGNQTISVSGNHSVTITGEQAQKIEGNQSVKITGQRIVKVTASGTEKVDGTRKTEVGGDCGMNIKATTTSTVQGTTSFKTQKDAGFDSATMITLSASGKVSIEGNATNVQGIANVSITVGSSTITITPAGITIMTPKLTISGKDVTCTAGAVNTMLAGLIKLN